MDIWKFIKSFNTANTYLLLSCILLMILILYFYVINPA
ncbi:putative membrane protein [Acinetobacter lactucae]|nr:putative membrane protein [Acinetobacter lactucae]